MTYKFIPKLLLLIVFLGFTNCTSNSDKNNKGEESMKSNKSIDIKLFELLSEDQTNIRFNNLLKEDLTYNYMVTDALYQGAGVGTGDINNDGLTDLYFAGNMVPDRLYLNKGNMQFEDITDKAGIVFNSLDWSTGVSFGDVNNDGFVDIYICKFLMENHLNRKNLLYINNGDLTFTEQAESYGLADMGYGIQATFIDYDLDGWLDLYVANQPPSFAHLKKAMKNTINYIYTDKLFRNNQNNTFSDVTVKAGLVNYTYTLGVVSSDINRDGMPDLYIANDYEEPDALMINKGDGTFENIINESVKHMSNFSMGADVADINNDGWPDVYVPDMVAKDNYRSKTNMSGMNPERFWTLVKHGYHHQYMFNTLQLNNGNNTFSEIAQLSGISNTDWTWSALLADFDNDGYKDLHLTNGLLRDIRNKDYDIKMRAYIKEQKAKGLKEFNPIEILNLAPSEKISNFIFKNNGDLTFSDKSESWGHLKKTFSQGSLYADLDNDGDLDLVINNMNDIASVYKNFCSENKLNNYLRLKLLGEQGNLFAFGSKATIEFEDGNSQMLEFSPNRGYMSTSEFVLHFGLGKNTKVSKLTIDWPNGKQTLLFNVSANQVLTLNINEATITNSNKNNKPLTLFIDESKMIPLKHIENSYDDYKKEVLLPHKMSTLGPIVAISDVNNDGLDDIYYGGSAGHAGSIFIQQSNGTFIKNTPIAFSNDKKYEDSDALFLDVDLDGDEDLFVLSGGNEASNKSDYYRDRLYLNNGKGNFSLSKNILPEINISSGVITASDIDKDGDVDLFIGGRQIPGQYGLNPESYILENVDGKFNIATEKIGKDINNIGMVTDALWFDFDADNDEDLFIVGEWMKITCFKNDNGQLINVSDDIGFKNTEGWWNRLVLADMDNDGDKDLIAGNLGLNIKYKASTTEPFKLYAKDFDENGTHDIYLGYYQGGKTYPVRGRACSSEQMPFIKKEFETYSEFALASVDEILGERSKEAEIKDAKMFESSYIENLGNGKFKVKPLPVLAQMAPVFGIIPNDWNNDGNLDLLIAGNYYNREVETTRSDAGIGQILIGNGRGEFKVLSHDKTGLKMNKDVRDLVIVRINNKKYVLVANNNDVAQLYKLRDE